METQYHELSWWAGNSGTQAMMLSPCPPWDMQYRGVFLSERTVLPILCRRREQGAIRTTTRIQAQRKGHSRQAPQGPRCAPV